MKTRRSDLPASRRSSVSTPRRRAVDRWRVGGVSAAIDGPRGRVPAAGVTVAGVLPTYRRWGLLRAMMRALLDACRVAGDPVAYLWATEDTIYGRFGLPTTFSVRKPCRGVLKFSNRGQHR